MENLVWIIYLIDTIQGVKVMSVIFSGVLWLAFVFLILIVAFERMPELLRPVKIVGIAAGVTLFLALFVPGKSTSYKILAAYGINELSQMEEVKGIASESFKLLENTLKDYNQQFEVKEVKEDGQQK